MLKTDVSDAGQCYVQGFHDNGKPGHIMSCKTVICTPVKFMEMCVVLIVVLGLSQKLLFVSALYEFFLKVLIL